MSETALAKKTDTGYLVLNGDAEDLTELVLANLGGETADVSPFDLPQIKVPAGESSWQIPGPGGRIDVQRELKGIILAFNDCRAFFPNEEDEAPSCTSPNGRMGYGDPGGVCAECPYAQWESDLKGGKGQACSAKRRLFLLQEGMILPNLITLPTTSVRGCKRFFVGMISGQIPFWGAVVTLTLRVESKGAQKWSEVDFAIDRVLDPEESAQVKAYSESIRPMLTETPRATVQMESGDAGGVDL